MSASQNTRIQNTQEMWGRSSTKLWIAENSAVISSCPCWEPLASINTVYLWVARSQMALVLSIPRPARKRCASAYPSCSWLSRYWRVSLTASISPFSLNNLKSRVPGDPGHGRSFLKNFVLGMLCSPEEGTAGSRRPENLHRKWTV